jgi:hypothetical protein
MTEPISFRAPRLTPAAQLRRRVLEQCLDVTLAKEGRTRRYWIRPGKAEGQWYCQVWFGDRTQHRGDTTDDWLLVQRVKAEYCREIDELERDGWIIADGIDPRPPVSGD